VIFARSRLSFTSERSSRRQSIVTLTFSDDLTMSAKLEKGEQWWYYVWKCPRCNWKPEYPVEAFTMSEIPFGLLRAGL
jgi:hypothetical protein